MTVKVAPESKNLSRVKSPVLIPLAIALCILCSAFYVVVSNLSDNHLKDNLVNAVTRFDDQTYQVSQQQGKLMLHNLLWITDRFMNLRDTDSRLIDEHLQELFRAAKDSISITRIMYVSPELKILGEVWDEQMISQVESTAMDMAIEEEQPVVDLVLLDNGELLLRAVMPVMSEGRLKGYLVMDKPLDRLAKTLALGQNIYMSMLVNKDLLDTDMIRKRTRVYSKDLLYNQFSKFLSVNNNNRLLDQNAFVDILDDYYINNTGNDIYYSTGVLVDKRIFDVGIVPISNAAGDIFAHLLIATDLGSLLYLQVSLLAYSLLCYLLSFTSC